MSQYVLAGKLKIPSWEDYRKSGQICRYNHGLMREKGLEKGGAPGDYYLYLQAVYRENLEAYLLEALDIEALDERMRDSGMGFESSRDEEKDLYEKGSSMGLAYLYLKNNLYIEYLDESQLGLLDRQLKTQKTAVTDELKKMAKDTFRDVIRVRDPENWEDRRGFLYPPAKGRMPEIPSQALVLAITDHIRYDGEGNFQPGDHRKERRAYLGRIKESKEREYAQILGCQVYILIPWYSAAEPAIH